MICDLCGKKGVARNMCWACYQAWRRSIRLSEPGCTCQQEGMLCQRCFWLRDTLVKALARTTEDGDCWVWAGSRHPVGFGYIEVNRVSHPVHRYVYERLVGPVDGQIVEHTCGNRVCLNPEHMYLHDAKGIAAEAAAKAMRNAGFEPVEPFPGSAAKPWKCLCPHCGEVFTPTMSNVTHGFTKGCRACGIKHREAMYQAQGFRTERRNKQNG